MLSFSVDGYQKALRFAAHAHGGQKVPGTDLPYLVHVCTVASEVIGALSESHFDPDLAVQCALLHDVVEDTTVGLDRVDAEFGAGVAAGVAALTKSSSLPKDLQMADSLERICRQPQAVWIVKLADRIANLQPPPSHWTPDRCRRYREEAEVILAALGSASPILLARFQARLRDYRRFEG